MRISSDANRQDRAIMVPAHTGPTTFPNTPLFNRLIRFLYRDPHKVIIRDSLASTQHTRLELLSDVLNIRNHIKSVLDPVSTKALADGEEVYIAIWAAGGYEYVVAMLAVLALGAATVPMSPALPVDEAAYYICKSWASCILVSSSSDVATKGSQLQHKINTTSNCRFQAVPIAPHLGRIEVKSEEIFTSSDRPLDEGAPGVVIFTSGTTGPPKGAVMRRSYVSDGTLAVADHFDVSEHDSMLHLLPVHHATGVGIAFFPFLVAGALIEFRSGGFDEAWTWERWREGARAEGSRLTFFCGIPTIYMRMRRYFLRTIAKLPKSEVEEYVAGARQFRACLCGTSALPQPLSEFWTDILGKRIVQRYGGTEFGAVLKMQIGDDGVPEGSVGEKVTGIDLKLSEGDEGEVLVKSPHMFMKYLYDPEATAAAHEKDGYFKTGDIARRVGKHYFIVGRASLDILKSGGYKISALDVEREILSLPYISEVMVVGVADEEFGQRVAALISLQEEELNEHWRDSHSDDRHVLTLDALRLDLKSRLAGYKMPTMLRVLDGDLPKSPTGKVSKKLLGPQFFPEGYASIPEIQVWIVTKPQAKARL